VAHKIKTRVNVAKIYSGEKQSAIRKTLDCEWKTNPTKWRRWSQVHVAHVVLLK